MHQNMVRESFQASKKTIYLERKIILKFYALFMHKATHKRLAMVP